MVTVRVVNKRLLLDDFLPYRLSIASNRVSDAVASTYRALFGLRIPEWRLVTVIAEHDGITQQALCVATRMDKVTVSRAAIALVDRGLVDRHANTGDQRSHLLALTEAGRTLYEEVAPRALTIERDLFAGFTPQEIEVLRDMLARIQDAADVLEERTAAAQ
ncbi:MarR family winged helix-turn-helix transcriptional regulator [Sphingomonas sp. Leaf4]|uniref:MarR family winged helix-turn-helix transcriptional regulator n=1 Tax=Sphingomonas sp. Leaf4 TaxID=2876553 RepID=UPI001E2DB5D7|nr:MarR family transcriptional regulator [Sphingomonas sp. Leaf4]